MSNVVGKLCVVGLMALLVQACKHPLAILGEGDIVDAGGSGFGCTLEQYSVNDPACVDNNVGDVDYIVDYQGMARSGWKLLGWQGSCGHLTVAPNCRFDVPAVWTTWWNENIPDFASPPLRAVFVPEDADFGNEYLLANMLICMEDDLVLDDCDRDWLVFELYASDTPLSVANFLNYVDSGRFDTLLWHRILNNFVIQAGEYVVQNSSLAFVEKFDAIQNESSPDRQNIRGSMAVALPSDQNQVPLWNEGTSNFYINLKHNSHLDWVSEGTPGYTVFGRVAAGMDVVDTIAGVAVDGSGFPAKFVWVEEWVHIAPVSAP